MNWEVEACNLNKRNRSRDNSDYLIWYKHAKRFGNTFSNIRNKRVLQVTKSSWLSISLNPSKVRELQHGQCQRNKKNQDKLQTIICFSEIFKEMMEKERKLTTLSVETPKISVFNFSNSAYRSLKAVISTQNKAEKRWIRIHYHI